MELPICCPSPPAPELVDRQSSVAEFRVGIALRRRDQLVSEMCLYCSHVRDVLKFRRA